MSKNSPTSMENNSSETKPRDMTVDEYSQLVAKWQQAYYTWNISCINYYNIMMLNLTQEFLQQIPILTHTNLLSILNETDHLIPFDRLEEIRNARLKVASMWRRFFAELIDFTFLHIFKILLVFFLTNYSDMIDENRLTLSYVISNFLYDETFMFPFELICIEVIYLITSIAFESICLTRYAATPGKLLLRLRVLKCNHLQMQENGDVTIEPGTMLNCGAALTRSSFKSLMSTFLFPAVIAALLTSQYRQTSYDMAANAVVVVLEPRE